MAEVLEEHDIFWMEDPFETRDYSQYAELQEEVDVNVFISSGPSSMELSRMFRSGGTTNIISVSVEHSGGISKAVKVATLADSWDLKISAITHEPIGSLATFHVWKAAPPRTTEGSFVEYDPMNSCWEQLLIDPPEFRNGELVLSDKPGLGTGIDDEFIDEHPLPDESIPQPF